MPEGCTIARVEPGAAIELVRGLARGHVADTGMLKELEGQGPGGTGKELWVLAHTDHGVTWGAIEGRTVRLSCSAIPDWPTPKIEAHSLQQLRIFGSLGEVLIWRDEDQPRPAALAGRVLLDCDDKCAPDLQPRDGTRIIAASRVAPGGETAGGFTAVAEGNGRAQVVPLRLSAADFVSRGCAGAYPLALRVKEYFERDPVTGCVRIAASRLVGLVQRGEA